MMCGVHLGVASEWHFVWGGHVTDTPRRHHGVHLDEMFAQFDGKQEKLPAVATAVFLRIVPVVAQFVYADGAGRIKQLLTDLAGVNARLRVHGVDVVLQVALGW